MLPLRKKPLPVSIFRGCDDLFGAGFCGWGKIEPKHALEGNAKVTKLSPAAIVA
jgi:hypothetical protein